MPAVVKIPPQTPSMSALFLKKPSTNCGLTSSGSHPVVPRQPLHYNRRHRHRYHHSHPSLARVCRLGSIRDAEVDVSLGITGPITTDQANHDGSRPSHDQGVGDSSDSSSQSSGFEPKSCQTLEQSVTVTPTTSHASGQHSPLSPVLVKSPISVCSEPSPHQSWVALDAEVVDDQDQGPTTEWTEDMGTAVIRPPSSLRAYGPTCPERRLSGMGRSQSSSSCPLPLIDHSAPQQQLLVATGAALSRPVSRRQELLPHSMSADDIRVNRHWDDPARLRPELSPHAYYHEVSYPTMSPKAMSQNADGEPRWTEVPRPIESEYALSLVDGVDVPRLRPQSIVRMDDDAPKVYDDGPSSGGNSYAASEEAHVPTTMTTSRHAASEASEDDSARPAKQPGAFFDLTHTTTNPGGGLVGLGGAPGVPLPPEVLETIRISIANFPETMLLCSSLSIETIRSYSRKLKHTQLADKMEADMLFSSADDPPERDYDDHHHRRWKIPKLRSIRRAAACHPLMKSSSSSPSSPLPRPGTGISRRRQDSLDSRASTSTLDWAPLKNIFPNGTEYAYDALYAHLVAYNYISALGLSSTSTTLSRRGSRRSRALTHHSSSSSSSSSVHTMRGSLEISNKAAALLGLSVPDAAVPDTTRPSFGAGKSRMDRKALFAHAHDAAPAHRHGGSTGLPGTNPAAAASTAAGLADMLEGLARCIAHLVATLNLTHWEEAPHHALAKRTSGGAAGVAKAPPLDHVTFKALCEVVRCSEGAA